VELWRAHEIETFDMGVVRLLASQGVRLWFGVSDSSRETLKTEITFSVGQLSRGA
jgi:hypothetical protein